MLTILKTVILALRGWFFRYWSGVCSDCFHIGSIENAGRRI